MNDTGIKVFEVSSSSPSFFADASDGSTTMGVEADDVFVKFDGTDLKIGSKTKMLGADAFNNNHVYITRDHADDAENSEGTGSGGTVSAPTVDGALNVVSGTTSGGYAYYYFVQSTLTTTVLDWSKRRRWKARVSTFLLSGQICIGMGDIDLSNNLNKAVFKIDSTGAAFGVTADGTGQASVDLSTTLSTLGTVLLEIDYDNNGTTCDFYINAVYKASTTTKLPTSSISNNELSGVRCDEVSGGGSSVSYCCFKFLQEE